MEEEVRQEAIRRNLGGESPHTLWVRIVKYEFLANNILI